MVYRLFCLQSHYRKNLVFSYENLDNAKTTYEKLVSRVASLKTDGEVDTAAFAELKKDFTDALDNDLNTSLAITAIYNVLKAKCSDATKLALIEDFDRVLGLDLVQKAKAQVADEEAKKAAVSDDPFIREIEEKIQARADAKRAKDYALADAIRKELSDRGVTLIDTPQGTMYEINK